ncbi:DUF87 domain-containing protein [Caulobacter sp. 1776]|uniref:helicase HerA domain-containing protein n=1 Tax=Caulobacter sp. 1776 TaxID=3156420 RepID=UPI003396325C
MTVAALSEPRSPVTSKLEIGSYNGATTLVDLDKLLAGRLLIQGSSGAGKSHTLRRLVEEAFEFVTTMIVDPEGEFGNLAAHIGATTLRASELAADGLTAAASRARQHRLPLHLDLTDLAPDERIVKAAAFFAGLLGCPRAYWSNTVLVAIDEAHLLAPHLAASARDAETRRLGVATLTDLCSRGRKRGIASVIATQRLAKLSGSVTSELHNALVGLTVFDRDLVRAADLLGFSGDRATELRRLAPGEFYGIGPALSVMPRLTKIGPTVTAHLGATPELVGPADATQDESRSLLDLDALRETGASARPALAGQRGGRMLDSFLMDPAAGAAMKIVESLRKIAPNATTASNLVEHLRLEQDAVDRALDLLGAVGAVDTMPRGDARIARLSAKLRLRAAEAPVVGLA